MVTAAAALSQRRASSVLVVSAFHRSRLRVRSAPRSFRAQRTGKFPYAAHQEVPCAAHTGAFHVRSAPGSGAAHQGREQRVRKTHTRSGREAAMTPPRRRSSLCLVVRWGSGAVASVGALTLAVAVMPAGAASIHHAANRYTQTNLISNRGDQGAQVMDENLLNPWGLAFGPTTPLWVADNNAGVATVYSVNPGGTSVTKRNLTVALPGGRASTGDGPSPTGQVFNAKSGFVVPSTAGRGPALFTFSAEPAQLTHSNPPPHPNTTVTT